MNFEESKRDKESTRCFENSERSYKSPEKYLPDDTDFNEFTFQRWSIQLRGAIGRIPSFFWLEEECTWNNGIIGIQLTWDAGPTSNVLAGPK